MALAYLAAFGCALCYGVGSILQDIAAKRVEADSKLDARLLVRVTTQLPYVGGLGLDLVGWVLSLLALLRLPLFAVQAISASSIGVVVVLSAAITKVRPGRRQVAILAVLGVGLVALAATAAPDRPKAVGGAFTVVMWIGVLLIAAAGAVVARTLTGDRAGAVLGALSGLAFGGTALCARALEAHVKISSLPLDPLSWALLVFGALGVSLYAAALQRGSVTVATACQYALDTSVPAVVGLAVLGDHARNGLAGVAAVGFLLTLGAAIALTLQSGPRSSSARPGSGSDPGARGAPVAGPPARGPAPSSGPTPPR
jgi:drug/metabolite transporter (DMT)-like permease